MRGSELRFVGQHELRPMKENTARKQAGTNSLSPPGVADARARSTLSCLERWRRNSHQDGKTENVEVC